jgi:C1A family cysteine protease
MKSNLFFGIVCLLALTYSYKVELTAPQLIMNQILNDSPKQAFKVWHFIHKNNEYDINTEEAVTRYRIFKKNFNDILEHNLDSQNKWKKSLNQFSDLSDDEFNQKYLTYSPTSEKELKQAIVEAEDWNNFRPQVSYYSQDDIVDYQPIDYTEWCPEVYNQNACGACYVFSTATAVECNYNKLYNKTGTDKLVMSKQQVIDCSTVTNGCRGGSGEFASLHYNSRGIYTESDYQYTMRKGQCKYNDLKQNGVKPLHIIKGYENLCYPLWPSMRDCRFKASAYQVLLKGPFFSSLDATSLRNYSSGVLEPKNCSRVNHTVVIIGYGVDEQLGDYWIARNSWGSDWGENGNVRIKAGETNESVCFLYSGLMRPTLKK